jgi:hypothetical protein
MARKKVIETRKRVSVLTIIKTSRWTSCDTEGPRY